MIVEPPRKADVADNVHRKTFLEKLVKENGFTRGAELGVQTGVTYFHLIDNCPDLTLIGVDAWIYPQFQKDYDLCREYVEQTAKDNPRAIIMRMTTNEAAKQVPDASLDFIFIDADHSYSAVKGDIVNWLPKIKPGGYITGHDIGTASVKKAVDEILGPLTYSIDINEVWYKKV